MEMEGLMGRERAMENACDWGAVPVKGAHDAVHAMPGIHRRGLRDWAMMSEETNAVCRL